MVLNSRTFNSECKEISGGNYLHLIDIETIDSKLEKFLDESIVKICEGNVNTDLTIIKKRLIDYLTPKKGSTIEMGAIAEFFTHLYLNEIGFKQEFLFLNLEEGSIKKGFDGYYSLSGEEWIYESKSGSINTAGISHDKKVKESYEDLKKKISGKVANNPWQNAYHHANLIDVGSAEDLRKNLKKLSEEFTKKKYHDIKNFNIMPGSTIFLEGNWESVKSGDLENKIGELVSKFDFKRINVICVNKKSLRLFWEYLEKK